MSLTPLTCDLLGWRGTGSADGSSDIAAYLFFGGVLMNVAAVQEVCHQKYNFYQASGA